MNRHSPGSRVLGSVGLGVAAMALSTAAHATLYTGSGGVIPDNDPAGFVSEIAIDEEFIVDEITINLDGLVHTWIGDLVVFVSYEGVDGSAGSSLFNRVGKTDPGTGFGDSSNLDGLYSFNDAGGDLWTAAAAASGTDAVVPPGVYFASGGLSPSMLSLNAVFGGIVAKGTWRLSIVDAAGGDLGELGGWSLDFVKSPVPTPASAALLGVVAMLGGRRRRR